MAMSQHVVQYALPTPVLLNATRAAHPSPFAGLCGHIEPITTPKLDSPWRRSRLEGMRQILHQHSQHSDGWPV